MQPATRDAQLGLRAERAEQTSEQVIFAEIEKHVGTRNFTNWFEGRTTATLAGDQLVVGVASPFVLNWMQRQFRSPVQQAAQSLLGPFARLRFQVDSRASLKPVRDASEGTNGTAVSVGTERSRPAASAGAVQPAPRNGGGRNNRPSGRRFADLAEFVRGPCNELALTATQQVCEAPGRGINPLYIHGGVGIGKTHLLEAIHQRIRRAFPALHVLFLTSETFANYFTQSLRERAPASFRQRFRHVDVLLIDDADFFDGKWKIQEEFLHTFKQLESQGRQIVVTANRHPRLLTKLSDELSTRFLSGLVCRIETPDLATRKRIVTAKSARLDAEFTPEALDFVARRFKNNVRELEGALNCLQTYFRMTHKQVGITAARKVLADLERDCIRIVRMSDVEHVVCRTFGLTPQDLKSASRTRSLSQPRMLAMFLARKHTQAAYSEIGQYFGGRNHSTVMSAEKKVQGWLDGCRRVQVASQNWSFDELVDSMEQQLLAG